MNLNKLFPFLSIRTKLIVAFSMLSFIPLAVIGTFAIYNSISSMHKKALENLHHDVELVNEKAQNFLSVIGLDIRFLIKSPAFQQYLDYSAGVDDSPGEKRIHYLEKELFTYANVKKNIFQFRFINSDGVEQSSIQDIDGEYHIISKERLSTSHFNFYFILTEHLEKDQMAFTPVELFTPDHATVPAISFASRVYNSESQFAGIFVTDIYAKHLFEILEEEIHTNFERKLAIVNNEGDYLYHSERKRDWNRLLASRKENNLLEDYPENYTNAILSGGEGILQEDHEEIVAYMPLFTSFFSGGHSYFIFESVEESKIIGPYCVLSPEAVAMLKKAGIKAIRLEVGLPEWKQAGLPVDRIN